MQKAVSSIKKSLHSRRKGAVATALAMALALTAALSGCSGADEGTGKDYGSCYVATKIATYDDGALFSTTTYELDDRGNCVRMTEAYEPGSLFGEYETSTTYSRDGNGIPTKARGEHACTTTVEEVDEYSQPVRIVEDDDGYKTVTTIEYWGEGSVRSIHSEADLGGGRTSVTNHVFNEDGFQTRRLVEGLIDEQYSCIRDPEGLVVKKIPIKGSSVEFTYEYDENGNVCAISQNGKLYREIEYVLVENPSLWAFVGSNLAGGELYWCF